jgi:predicted regulator of Ras-like GTPase activity (Roadblock/LC7/MglB family)
VAVAQGLVVLVVQAAQETRLILFHHKVTMVLTAQPQAILVVVAVAQMRLGQIKTVALELQTPSVGQA